VDGEEMFSRYWSPGIRQNGKILDDTENRFGPDIYCSFLKDFIRRNRSRPFFAYYSMTLPHQPFVLPPGMGDDREGTRAPGKQARDNFRAMVEYMDKLVGDLVSTLDTLGIRENTLVLFTGDNGAPTQVKSRMKNRTIAGGKFTLTEAGTRVPLIASWPKTAGKGVVSTDLVDFSDILPTLVEAAGASLPEDVVFDGTSFLPQLEGKKGNPREWIYCQLREDWFIRDHRFKLMHDGTLFNMEFRYFPREQKTRIGPDAALAKKRLLETATRIRKPRE
jgi:arylsulfatase A-like enzyme